MLGARIDEKLEKKLEKYAKKSGQTKSHVVKRALEKFLADQNIFAEHDRLTLKGWDEIKNGEGLPADEVFSYLDTWGTSEEI